MIFLTHTRKKTNVFQFRIVEIRFSLEFKYPPVFITDILFLVSVMSLDVSERGIFLNPSVEKEAIWMHLDRHPEMPRASVDPEESPSASCIDTSLWGFHEESLVGRPALT